MLIVWLVRGRPLPARRDLPGIALLGAFGFTLYNLGINYGERTVDAGTGSMLISCVPILVVLYGAVTRQEKVTLFAWLGILTSMVGVALTSGVVENGVTLNEGTALIFGAALCAAAQTLLSKHLTRHYAAIDVTTWAIWFGTLGLLPFSHNLVGTAGGSTQPRGDTCSSWASYRRRCATPFGRGSCSACPSPPSWARSM